MTTIERARTDGQACDEARARGDYPPVFAGKEAARVSLPPRTQDRVREILTDLATHPLADRETSLAAMRALSALSATRSVGRALDQLAEVDNPAADLLSLAAARHACEVSIRRRTAA